jgi:diaminopimelate epimerase
VRLRFVKGHGTENDFVVLPDLDQEALTPALVRTLCDRHAGIGADGVLRVGRDGAGWFMDYRNADGSVAEMCGNGMRVFARYLVDAGLERPGTFEVGTRGGPRRVRVPATGDVSVDMGEPTLLDRTPSVAGVPATAVSMGNPHVVVSVPTAAELAGLDLTRPPAVVPPLPGGQNVEFVLRTGPRQLRVRVHERGAGETRACGTGVCAAVVATVHIGRDGAGEEWAVDVPGGRLAVRWAGTVELTGPAVLVAAGELLLDPDRLDGDQLVLGAG